MDYREAKKMADEARDAALKFLHQEKRSKDEEAQMITAAQAAVFLWSKAGTPLQVARAHWLASKCFFRMQEARLSHLHAQLCDFHTKKAGDRRDSDEARAIEALAASGFLKGDLENGRQLKAQAQELGQKIKDPQERTEFLKYLQWLDQWN